MLMDAILKKEQLGAIVGQPHVLDDAASLDGYGRDQSLAPALKPWFVVRPGDGAQVQALVAWANQTRTPLIPVSSGPPHFHGDTVPSVPEAVIVDLTRVNAIRRIDPRNRIAVIEPGVTYAQLDAALAAQGLRIPRPLAPRANKSVVASLLERQPTLIPRFNYNLPEPLRTCGVVWGTGELAFTGEAGTGPLSLDDQWQRGLAQVDPKGPLATDLMRVVTGAQGTMGIVVWASVKLELLPAAREYRFAPGQSLGELVDFCYRLERTRLGDAVEVFNAAQLAQLAGRAAAAVAATKRKLPQRA
ncbi:MAG: FAD-binding oxidoreductase, partial [Acidobacteria bacterium]